MSREIPTSVIAHVAEIVGKYYSHTDIDQAFDKADAPEANPGSNKQTKISNRLKVANESYNQPRKVLGIFLHDFMESAWPGADQSALREAREKIRSILASKGLQYIHGGDVELSAPSRPAVSAQLSPATRAASAAPPTAAPASPQPQAPAPAASVPARSPASVATSAASPSSPLVDYELREKVGSGGYGEVWKAWSARSSRWVAVKKPRQGESRIIESLRKEAICLLRVRHPSFPALLGCSFEPGNEFIAMDFVDGTTADQWIKGNATLASRLDLLESTADALQHMHQNTAIVHRDLKLENIMVDGKGAPIILDLGLAKTDLREEQTHDARHLANIRNTPPECFAHIFSFADDPVQYGALQEVWSFGCVAWQMLLGYHPFERQGDIAGTIAAIQKKQLPNKGVELLPEVVRQLLVDMLAFEAAARPDMAAISASLRGLRVARGS